MLWTVPTYETRKEIRNGGSTVIPRESVVRLGFFLEKTATETACPWFLNLKSNLQSKLSIRFRFRKFQFGYNWISFVFKTASQKVYKTNMISIFGKQIIKFNKQENWKWHQIVASENNRPINGRILLVFSIYFTWFSIFIIRRKTQFTDFSLVQPLVEYVKRNTNH